MGDKPIQPSLEAPLTTTEKSMVLIHQYSAAIGLLSQTNNRRTATARFYISLTSGLIALLTIAFRPGIDTGLQIQIINIIAVVSIFLSGVWYLTIKSLRRLAAVQRTLLKEMEAQLPFPFIARQEEELQRATPWISAGLMEQYLSLVMMTPALTLLWLANVG